MILTRRPWPRILPYGQAAPNRSSSGIFANKGVGLVLCGPTTKCILTGRPITTNAVLASTTHGLARLCSGTTIGVSTARREWANWEATATPFSLFGFWQLDSLSGSSVRCFGYSAGSTGFSIGQVIGGVRRYSIGSTNADTIGPTWPLGQMMSSVMTYDGTNIRGYLNGALDASVASSAPTFGTFDRVGAGGDADAEYTLNGKIMYFGLVNRVLSPYEIDYLARNPMSVFAPRRRFIAVNKPDTRSATAAITLGNVTLSGAFVKGSPAIVLGNVTLVSTVSDKIQATAAKTLANVTLSAASQTKVKAALAKTLDNITSTSSGGQRHTNLLLCTDSLDDASWEATAGTIVAKDGTAGPFGDSNEAWKLGEGVGSGFYYFNQNMGEHDALGPQFLDDFVDHTLSIYAKQGSGSRMLYIDCQNNLGTDCDATFDLTNGVIDGTPVNSTATITAVGSGWYRCSIKFNSNSGSHHPFFLFCIATNGGTQSTSGDDTSYIYVARPQVEAYGISDYVLRACNTGRSAALVYTLADITLAATSIAELKASAAVTLANTTLSSAVKNFDKASFAYTLANVTLSSTISSSLTASAAITLASVLLSSTAAAHVKAAAAVTLMNVLLSSTVSIKLKSATVITLDDIVLTSTIVHRRITTAAITLADVLLAATAAAKIRSATVITLADVTLSSAIVSPRKASAAIVLQDTTLISQVALQIQAMLGITLDDVTIRATAGLPPTYSPARTYHVHPENRIYKVTPEDRILTVRAEDRTFHMLPENRILTITPEDRTYRIKPEDRTYHVFPESPKDVT